MGARRPLLSILLALVGTIALLSCGGGEATPSPTASPANTPTSTTGDRAATGPAVVAGLTIESSRDFRYIARHTCTTPDHPTATIDWAQVDDPALAVRPESLPAGWVLQGAEAIACDGRAEAVSLTAVLPSTGGGADITVVIRKVRALPGVSTSFPSWQWTEGSISSWRAAVAPLLGGDSPAESGVLAYKGGVVFALLAYGSLSHEQLISLAEGQFP